MSISLSVYRDETPGPWLCLATTAAIRLSPGENFPTTCRRREVRREKGEMLCSSTRTVCSLAWNMYSTLQYTTRLASTLKYVTSLFMHQQRALQTRSFVECWHALKREPAAPAIAIARIYGTVQYEYCTYENYYYYCNHLLAVDPELNPTPPDETSHTLLCRPLHAVLFPPHAVLV